LSHLQCCSLENNVRLEFLGKSHPHKEQVPGQVRLANCCSFVSDIKGLASFIRSVLPGKRDSGSNDGNLAFRIHRGLKTAEI
jgi:hypothetical protein